jgi:hypothetical protein
MSIELQSSASTLSFSDNGGGGVRGVSSLAPPVGEVIHIQLRVNPESRPAGMGLASFARACSSVRVLG